MYHAASVKYFSFNLPINSIFSIFLTIMQLYLFILLDQTKQNKKKEEFENLKYEQEFISDRTYRSTLLSLKE